MKSAKLNFVGSLSRTSRVVAACVVASVAMACSATDQSVEDVASVKSELRSCGSQVPSWTDSLPTPPAVGNWTSDPYDANWRNVSAGSANASCKYGPLSDAGAVVYTSGVATGVTGKTYGQFSNITYANRGGLALAADLFVPEWSLPTARPGVLMAIHGGGWQDCHQRRGNSIMNSLMDMSAKANTAVFNVEYRLENEGGRYPNNLTDVKCALQYVKGWAIAHSSMVDPTRIGVVGESAGAHLSLMLALTEDRGDLNPHCTYPGVPEQPPTMNAVWAWSPPTDMPWMAANSIASSMVLKYTNSRDYWDVPISGRENCATPIPATDSSCIGSTRCIDASPVFQAAGYAPGTHIWVISAPDGTPYNWDQFVSQKNTDDLVARVKSRFPTADITKLIAGATSLSAAGCNNTVQLGQPGSNTAHGVTAPCMKAALGNAYFVPDVQAQIGGR